MSVSIGGDKRGSIILPRILGGMKPAIRRALIKSGAQLEGQIKKHLSGPSHTLFPGNANPFPGVYHGKLRSSITHRVVKGGTGLIVGPGRSVKYARIHEVGGDAGRGGRTQIPARPYIKPAWQKLRKTVIRNIKMAILRFAK